MRVLAALVIAAALVLGAPPGERREIVRVPVWENSNTTLRADALVAMANGKQIRVIRLHRPSDDLLVLLVLDLVADLSEINIAREALSNSIAEMPGNVYFGLLRAQDGMHVLLDPTDDRNAILEKIRSFTVSGTPGLLESIETVAELGDAILAKAPVRIAILYVTDSDVRDYREDFTNPVINYSDRGDLSRRFPESLIRERMSKLNAKIESTETPIFVVHLEYSSDRLNEAYQAGLTEITTATGGEAVFCRSNSEIPTAIEAMLRKIAAHYAVDLQVAGHAGDTIELTLESGGKTLTSRSRIRLKKRKGN